ncbi:MAG: C_GCAxxG_C_C family protein [Clostridiales bacterium]|nr:C_GCAxxG_C_C family protein [Clostridiales bacterium]
MENNKNIQAFNCGYNCAQAVLLGKCEELGLDVKMASKLAELFGGGLSGMRTDVCGAVSGALMLLGLHFGRTEGEDTETKESAGKLGREFIATFTEKFGAIRCGELIKIAAEKDPESVKRVGAHMPVCTEMVCYAAELAEKMIGE